MSPNPPPPGGSLRSWLKRLSPHFSRVNPPGEPGPDPGTVPARDSPRRNASAFARRNGGFCTSPQRVHHAKPFARP